MNKSLKFLTLSFAGFLLFSSCYNTDPVANYPTVVTKDIQIGIEKYIDFKTREGKGYFKFSSGDNNFSFMLVRIHTEYLANLSYQHHFACVCLGQTKSSQLTFKS